MTLILIKEAEVAYVHTQYNFKLFFCKIGHFFAGIYVIGFTKILRNKIRLNMTELELFYCKMFEQIIKVDITSD